LVILQEKNKAPIAGGFLNLMIRMKLTIELLESLVYLNNLNPFKDISGSCCGISVGGKDIMTIEISWSS
jgi:CO/xanthine dehydrogenase FAD-binding subunit